MGEFRIFVKKEKGNYKQSVSEEANRIEGLSPVQKKDFPWEAGSGRDQRRCGSLKPGHQRSTKTPESRGCAILDKWDQGQSCSVGIGQAQKGRCSAQDNHSWLKCSKATVCHYGVPWDTSPTQFPQQWWAPLIAQLQSGHNQTPSPAAGWEGQRSGGAQESHPSLLLSDSDFSSLGYMTRHEPPRLFAFHLKTLSPHFSHHRSRGGRKGGRNSQAKRSCQCLMGTGVKYYPEERKFGVLPIGFIFPVLFLLLNDKEGWRSACILLSILLKTRHLLLLSVLSDAQEV